MIPFNKPYYTGIEIKYIQKVIDSGKTSGNGIYTSKCQEYFEQKYDIKKALLTTSCTDALEMCAMLAEIKLGDEVIVPSYTFVSTALAFVRQGAKIIFADSRDDHPGIDEDLIEDLITDKTKAIVPVHYAGVACDMDKIMDIASRHSLIVIEDAAQAIDNYYMGKDGTKRALGSIGHLAAFSFHETKNIISGEGGLLAINDDKYIKRAEIIWEKGTNRSEFFRNEVNKYGWVDTGSSFLPSEMIAAYLWAQLEMLEQIQTKRLRIWDRYYSELKRILINSSIRLPYIPEYSTNNAHMFYLICSSLEQRNALIKGLKENNIHAVFHYLSLHKSQYYKKYYETIPALDVSDRYTDCLIRLPMFYELKDSEITIICDAISNII